MSNDLDSIEEITGLALCSGGNGLELGLRIAIPNYRSIAISEGEAYCLAATAARIQEGSMGITGALGGIFAPGPADARWNDVLVRNGWLRPSVSQAEIESPIHYLADGLADLVRLNRTDALRMLGNGVVPLCAATTFVELFRRMRVALGETTGTGA